ncbi:uncharacterized protein LOC126470914 [Schistocerca serialis cubense]|uniref:uncharacterized protein LOC126470914 n=1 Tax=Schistocerca serialis cubense TaxID=2023355 RepID=UPI00214EE7AD|nr:uncharacterized protein LOC126470914 [Schistocerca serialis cubense]
MSSTVVHTWLIVLAAESSAVIFLHVRPRGASPRRVGRGEGWGAAGGQRARASAWGAWLPPTAAGQHVCAPQCGARACGVRRPGSAACRERDRARVYVQGAAVMEQSGYTSPWAAVLGRHHAAAVPVMQDHHGYGPPGAAPIDLHVSQPFPYYRYQEEALCWSDRKHSVDDVSNPTSVNAR